MNTDKNVNRVPIVRRVAALAVAWAACTGPARAQEGAATRGAGVSTASVAVRLDQPAKPISHDLLGIFFEDLNYAADGGLYAELVSNRSFDYAAVDRPEWNALTGWDMVSRGGGTRGSLAVQDASPIHPNNPQYAVLSCANVGTGEGAGVGIRNAGFDGIALKAGETYDFSVFARQRPKSQVALEVRLESKDGALYGSAALPPLTNEWARYAVEVKSDHDDADARLVLMMMGARGAAYLDMVSLFPHRTFHDRPNGLRGDLAQAIADLKPKFVRFPGGCLTHGDGLGNIYRWKDTIGPVEQRKGQKNIWRYHQSIGLGYFEYFQFCEDIGAKPLPVLAAGVSCQNSDLMGGTGQQAIPMGQMDAYAQDVLDLVEYANGPASSTWGAKRAAAGHPEPFHLEYVGVGNEDAQTPAFRERFKMIYDALKAKHPEVTVVGTVGPAPAGHDFDAGWKFANELAVPVVDEHYYQQPGWFLGHMDRYDSYDRAHSKVYVGEYASWGNTLTNALAEAAHVTALERNGDVVHMASYAPLLCKEGHVQWYPDMIYFTNTEVLRSVNYYAQQMCMANQGDAYVPTTVSCSPEPAKGEAVTASSVLDGGSGDVIVKLVNVTGNVLRAQVQLSGARSVRPEATRTVLTGDPKATNAGDPRAKNNVSPQPMVPRTSPFTAGPSFSYDAPAYSLTVMRIRIDR